MQPEWQAVRRLLVVRLDNIGDVVMTSPALRTLKAALPGVQLTLLASPAGSQVAPLLPWVDAVIELRSLWQDVSGALAFEPERELALVAQLRAARFDAAVILTSFSQSPYPPAYLCYLAGIKTRLGQSREFGGGVLSLAVAPPPDSLHQAERNLHLLAAAGFAVAGEHLELAIGATAERTAAALLAELGIAGPFVLVAPGASCPARRYPAERFRELVLALQVDPGWPVLVVGTGREAPLLAVVAAGTAARVLADRTPVPVFAALVRRAALLVGNNSGPLHFADAFATPMVIFYSGTELESQWRPRRAPARLLRRPTDCSPCYRFECPEALACLDIPAAEAAAAARELLVHQGGRYR